jgi:hypothetical protein
MKKIIVLTVMLCITFTSTKILADCPDPQTVSTSVYCTMEPPYGWAHGLYYIGNNMDIYVNWYVSDGWGYAETGLGNTGYGSYGGTNLTTDYDGRFEVWLNSNNGGSGYLYASW